MLYYLTAITIGLMGSLHCIGMCGPIAMAVPLNVEGKAYRFLGSFNYLFGKAITYSLLGLFSGAFAKMLVLTGFQRYISLLTGVLILSIFILQKVGNGNLGLARLNYQWVGLLKQQFNKFLQEKNLISAFWLSLYSACWSGRSGWLVAKHALYVFIWFSQHASDVCTDDF